jgi:hypothetical protein
MLYDMIDGGCAAMVSGPIKGSSDDSTASSRSLRCHPDLRFPSISIQEDVELCQCYTGPLGGEFFKPIRDFMKPALDFWPIPHPALQSMFDPEFLRSQWYWKADFFNELSDKAVVSSTSNGAELPDAFHHASIPSMAQQAAWGKTTPHGPIATRSGQVIVGVDPDPANKTR